MCILKVFSRAKKRATINATQTCIYENEAQTQRSISVASSPQRIAFSITSNCSNVLKVVLPSPQSFRQFFPLDMPEEGNRNIDNERFNSSMSLDFTTDRFNYYLLAARIATAKFNGRVSKQRLFGTGFGRWGWLEGGRKREGAWRFFVGCESRYGQDYCGRAWGSLPLTDTLRTTITH